MSLAEALKDRVVVTHTGSLPRPDALSALMFRNDPTEAGDRAEAAAAAVRDIVDKQVALGLDVVSDGEQSKVSFQVYALERLSGLEAIAPQPGEQATKENAAFPAYYPTGHHAGSDWPRHAVTGPIEYIGRGKLKADLVNLKAALRGKAVVDAFMPSVSPASLAGLVDNRFYKDDEELVFAFGEALRVEYEAIVEAGFQLQVDDPRLAMHYMLHPEVTVEETRAWAGRRVEALNHALRNIASDRIRHHTCYGVNIGPRTTDLELKHLADLIVGIKADFYSFEMANPRHEHEWRVWEHVALPPEKVLIPGCITQSSVMVEHPDLVAERIVRLAGVVGRERVMAGADCGFASTLRPGQRPEIEPEIVWAKFESLAEGARRATKVLWADSP